LISKGEKMEFSKIEKIVWAIFSPVFIIFVEYNCYFIGRGNNLENPNVGGNMGLLLGFLAGLGMLLVVFLVYMFIRLGIEIMNS
jgi:hypothetical protein